MSQPVTMRRDADAFPDSHEAIVEADAVALFEEMGWTVADALDHDGNGKKGGSKARKKADAASGLTHAEICADLEAMGVEFDPRESADDLQVIRDVARAERATPPTE